MEGGAFGTSKYQRRVFPINLIEHLAAKGVISEVIENNSLFWIFNTEAKY